MSASESPWFVARQGKRFGPFNAEKIDQLVAGGKLQPSDMVWREGMPEWVAVSTVPELGSGSRSAAVAPAAPPLPSLPPTETPEPVGYYNPVAGRPATDIGQDAGIRMLLPVGRSGWAIAAGYLGLFGFLVLPAPLALIVSIIAILDMRKHPDRHGMGRAIFGLVIGILGTAALGLFLVFALMR